MGKWPKTEPKMFEIGRFMLTISKLEKFFCKIMAWQSMKYKRGEVTSVKQKANSKVAAGTVRILNAVLRTEANTASCGMAYQPKTPEKLAKFRRK